MSTTQPHHHLVVPASSYPQSRGKPVSPAQRRGEGLILVPALVGLLCVYKSKMDSGWITSPLRVARNTAQKETFSVHGSLNRVPTHLWVHREETQNKTRKYTDYPNALQTFRSVPLAFIQIHASYDLVQRFNQIFIWIVFSKWVGFLRHQLPLWAGRKKCLP